MTDDVRQEGNVAGGHISGRDTIVTYQTGKVASRRLAELVARFRAEREDDKSLESFIEELSCYTSPSDPASRPTLAQKLERGGRADQIDEAARLKELFWMRLARNQFSGVAQEIYAYLLGVIHLRFDAHIRPLISGGRPRHEIDAAVASQVIEPTLEEIDDNPLFLNVQQLRGMLYYLTGNCYVRWHR